MTARVDRFGRRRLRSDLAVAQAGRGQKLALMPDADGAVIAWDADNQIKGATSATYTPDSDDNGTCLLVMAKYVDGFYDDHHDV